MPDEKTGRLDEEFVVQMKGITKVYPNGVAANQGVEFCLRKGEIHALMGENGAGKSTLMKMLFGLEQPTSGEIWVNGEKLSLTSPSVAISHGIGMVHQPYRTARRRAPPAARGPLRTLLRVRLPVRRALRCACFRRSRRS